MRRWSVVLALLLATPATGAGQSSPSEDVVRVEDFVSAARAATARYRDQAAAIADGYRRIGPDFPSMGEHWISIPLVVQARLDPTRPPILEYANLRGRPTLMGVAYTRLAREEQPPEEPGFPVPATAWHYHAGTVDEESFILGHSQALHGPAPAGPRIAVLHAWIWQPNPAGLFATDNWALPWVRLGMAPPPGAGCAPATLAVALATDGEPYFRTLFRLVNHPTPVEEDSVAVILARHAATLRAALAAGFPPDTTALATGWADLEREIRGACRSCDPPFGTLVPGPSHP